MQNGWKTLDMDLLTNFDCLQGGTTNAILQYTIIVLCVFQMSITWWAREGASVLQSRYAQCIKTGKYPFSTKPSSYSNKSSWCDNLTWDVNGYKLLSNLRLNLFCEKNIKADCQHYRYCFASFSQYFFLLNWRECMKKWK